MLPYCYLMTEDVCGIMPGSSEEYVQVHPALGLLAGVVVVVMVVGLFLFVGWVSEGEARRAQAVESASSAVSADGEAGKEAVVGEVTAAVEGDAVSLVSDEGGGSRA